MKPPFANDLRVPKSNPTIYILAGRDKWERAQKRKGSCLLLPDDIDPEDLEWPVKGCGVILLDNGPMDEATAQRLGLAVKRDGAECLIWSNRVSGITSYVIGGPNG